MKKIILLILYSLLFIFYLNAHGVDISYKIEKKVIINAKYQSGEIMSEAQVLVFAPDDSLNPWAKGICDENGNYSFIPDMNKNGIWDVQIRKAGHGQIFHINLNEIKQEDKKSIFDIVKLILLSIFFIWGCIGTALFFLKKKGKQ